MARVDLTEPYAIRTLRKQVRESLMAHGEEVIALRMYHAAVDEHTQPRCPVCYDDVYSNSGKYDCDVCFGTTFDGGVKEMGRTWAMFSTDVLSEDEKKTGDYQPFSHQIQTEARPLLVENDYIVRITQWTKDHRPLDIYAVYDMKVITPETLRTGHQLGQDGKDYVGLKGKGSELPRSHPIYKVWKRLVSPDFPVPRVDGMRR